MGLAQARPNKLSCMQGPWIGRVLAQAARSVGNWSKPLGPPGGSHTAYKTMRQWQELPEGIQSKPEIVLFISWIVVCDVKPLVVSTFTISLKVFFQAACSFSIRGRHDERLQLAVISYLEMRKIMST